MSGAVGDEGDEVHVLALFTSEQAVNCVDEHMDDVDVLPFVEAADVIGLGNLAFVEDEVNGTGVVFNEQPVAHILSLAIYRQWLAMADVIDEEWNQFFRKLVRTIVVRAVGHDDRHSVGVVIGTHEVVARCFGC